MTKAKAKATKKPAAKKPAAPAPRKVVGVAKPTGLYRTPMRDLYVQTVETKGARRYVHCLTAHAAGKFRATVIQETAFFEAKPVLLSVNGVSVKELNKAKAAKKAPAKAAAPAKPKAGRKPKPAIEPAPSAPAEAPASA